MGFFDRFRGAADARSDADDRAAAGDADERAIERYRYMLATAPPEDIERAHEEAFARLTPQQRRAVLDQLAQHVPSNELRGDDPASLARAATRAEMRQPGTIERAFGGRAAPGLGSTFLTMLAASFIGTSIAQAFFAGDGAAGADAAGGADPGAENADASGYGDEGADYGAEAGELGDAGDFGGGDFGGDFGGDLGGF